MESLQEIMMDAYREGREDAVKSALERRREVKKTGKGSKVELHNAEFSSVEEEAAAALKMARKTNRGGASDFPDAPAEPKPKPESMPEAFSIFRAMKELLMKKDRAYHY